MRTNTLIVTLALGASVLAGGIFVPALAASNATKVEAMGYRDLQEIERDGDKFEVTATGPEGRLVELDVAPLTGEVLDTEFKRNN